MRLVGAGSKLLARAAPADELGGCCGRLGRVAARVTFCTTACLHLNPSMALASCSLSLLIQVHEAAAVVASGGDAGAEWRPAAASMRAADGRYRDVWSGVACPPSGACA